MHWTGWVKHLLQTENRFQLYPTLRFAQTYSGNDDSENTMVDKRLFHPTLLKLACLPKTHYRSMLMKWYPRKTLKYWKLVDKKEQGTGIFKVWLHETLMEPNEFVPLLCHENELFNFVVGKRRENVGPASDYLIFNTDGSVNWRAKCCFGRGDDIPDGSLASSKVQRVDKSPAGVPNVTILEEDRITGTWEIEDNHAYNTAYFCSKRGKRVYLKNCDPHEKREEMEKCVREVVTKMEYQPLLQGDPNDLMIKDSKGSPVTVKSESLPENPKPVNVPAMMMPLMFPSE